MTRAKAFSIALIAAAACLFGATVLANLVIDPEEVFGTNLIPAHGAPNERYHRFLDYQREARQVDGLFFGSSRAEIFQPEMVARYTKDQRVASFAVAAGSIVDHLAFLDYVLRDKAAHGERLKSALLFLDADVFGMVPWSNRNLDSFLPPQVTGDSKLRFWMRYLLAVQFKVWQGSIIRSRAVRSTHGPVAGDGAAPPTHLAALRVPRDVVADVPLLTVDLPEAVPGIAASRDRLDRISRSIKPYLAMHVDDLERFVALCRDNGVRLTVAINPMREENALGFEPGHLDAMVDRINSLSDVWDFKSPDWLARDSAYWLDVSHFSKPVAEMMLRRMYADGAGVPADFGRFRPRTAQAAAVQGAR